MDRTKAPVTDKKRPLALLAMLVALALALAAPLCAPAHAWAEEGEAVEQDTAKHVSTYDDLQKAVVAGGDIVLDADVSGNKPTLKCDGVNVSLDLGGHKLTLENYWTITNGAQVSVSNGDIVSSQSSRAIELQGAGNSLTLEKITLSSEKASTALVSNKSDGSTITIKESVLTAGTGAAVLVYPKNANTENSLSITGSTVTGAVQLEGAQTCSINATIDSSTVSSVVTTTQSGAKSAALGVAFSNNAAVGSVSLDTDSTISFSASGNSTVSDGFALSAKEGVTAAIEAGTTFGTTDADQKAAIQKLLPDTLKLDDNGKVVEPSAQKAVNVLDADGTTVKGSYDTLADAIANAESGQIVQLQQDIDLPATLVVEGKTITLDLNGKTISNSNDIWSDTSTKKSWSYLSVRAGANVTVTGNGTMQTKENDCYAMDVQGGGKLTVESGTFVGNCHAVYVLEGEAVINGGAYSIQQQHAGGDPYGFILNCYDSSFKEGKAKITVNGGTFLQGFDPFSCAAEGAGTSFVAEGVGVTKNQDGSYTAASGMAAQVVGEDGHSVAAYGTLQAAINAAGEGQTVKMLGNVTENITVADNKNITLDLNGKTLSSESGVTLTNEGTLAVVDNAGGGAITTGSGSTSYTVESHGTMTFGKEGADNKFTVKTGATITTSGGPSLVRNGDDPATTEKATMVIYGGTFNGGLNNVKNEKNGELTVKGGAFSLTAKPKGVTGNVLNYGTATIEGGSFTLSRTGFNPTPYCAAAMDGSTLYVTGGTFSASTGCGVVVKNGDNAKVAVSGGSFNKSPNANCWAEGYCSIKSGSMYGMQQGTVEVRFGSVDQACDTIADALKLAKENGASGETIEITLLKDHVEDVVIPSQSDLACDGVKLDLNGHTLKSSSSHAICNKGTLEISGAAGSAIVASTGGKQAVYNEGTLSFKSDCVASITRAEGTDSYVVVNAEGATMTVAAAVSITSSANASTLLNEGTLTLGGNGKSPTVKGASIAVKSGSGNGEGTLTVEYANITGGNQSIQNWAQATIKGGTLTGAVSSWAYTDSKENACGNTIIAGTDAKHPVIINPVSEDMPAVVAAYYDGAANGIPSVSISGETVVNGRMLKESVSTTTNVASPVESRDAHAAISVSGGSFKDVVDQNFCADGYVPVTTVDETTGMYTVAPFTLGVSSDGEKSVPASIVSGRGESTMVVKVSSDNIGGYTTEAYPTTSLTFTDANGNESGYIFAGWYSDETATTACASVPEGTDAYAKFVDARVLSVKGQINSTTTVDSASSDLRFITTVDCLDYKSVGFVIEYNETVLDKSSTTVYQKIVAQNGGVEYKAEPSVFSPSSTYFMTHTITGIPKAAFDVNFKVTPYWVTADGTRVDGAENNLTVNMGINANQGA